MDAQWPGGIAEPHSAGCRADHDRPVDHIDVEIAAGGARLKAAQTVTTVQADSLGTRTVSSRAALPRSQGRSGAITNSLPLRKSTRARSAASSSRLLPGRWGSKVTVAVGVGSAMMVMFPAGSRTSRSIGPSVGNSQEAMVWSPSYRDALLGQARQLRAKPVLRWPGPRRDGGGVEPAELSTARLTARISQV